MPRKRDRTCDRKEDRKTLAKRRKNQRSEPTREKNYHYSPLFMLTARNARGGEMNPQAINALAALMHELRPEWDTPGCVAALRKLTDMPLRELATAAIRYTADEQNTTPGNLPNFTNRAWDSAWYLPCKTHPGNRTRRTNGECGGCFADRTGVTNQPIHDRGGKPPAPEIREQILTAIRAPITDTPRRHRTRPANEVMAKARAELEQVRAAHATTEPTEAAT